MADEGNPIIFECRLGGAAMAATAGFVVLGIPFAALFFAIIPWLSWKDHQTGGLVLIAMADFAIVGVVAVVYTMCPRRYELWPTCLIVRRRGGGAVVYDYATMLSAEERRPSPIQGAERTGANGGFFGFNGYFCGGGLKNFEAHATTDESAVVIRRRKGDPVVISPDDHEGFLRELAAKMKVD